MAHEAYAAQVALLVRVLPHIASEGMIETSPVTRGVLHPPRLMTVSDAVQDRFGFAQTQVVAFEDLFGEG